MKDNRTHLTLSLALPLLSVALIVPDAPAQANQPNIAVIWNNDIGHWNISPNDHGMFGFRSVERRSHREERLRLRQLQSTTELYREAQCIPQPQRAEPQRHDEGRRARREGNPAEERRGQGTDCKNHDYAAGQAGRNHPGEWR